MSFVCVQGLAYLLEEWGLQLNAPILLIDNRSALTICELGGSWRTRYFAVRAARIAEETLHGRVQLRFCATAAMAADGLTKLASALVLDMLHSTMSARPPEIAPATATVANSDSWWAYFIRAHSAVVKAAPAAAAGTDLRFPVGSQIDCIPEDPEGTSDCDGFLSAED